MYSACGLGQVWELTVVQIDFSAVLIAYHSELLYNMSDVGVCVDVFDVIASFLRGRELRVMVDDFRSENIRVVSGVPQSDMMGPLLFLLYTSDVPIILENNFVGYAYDSP